jgi:hypothetical protein
MKHALETNVSVSAPNEARRWPAAPMILAATLAVALLVNGATHAATPIDNGTPTSLPAYSGAPAVPHRIRAKRPPRNPHMARNPRSNVHNDPWMTDTYRYKGPLGRAPQTLSASLGRVCVTVTFDGRGRIVATCSSLAGPRLFMLDPETLDTLAEFELPFVPPPPGTDPRLNTAGGAYFFLDNRDRATVATATRHIMIIGETGGRSSPGFALEQDFDVSGAVPDRITSVLPDWEGRLWFVGRYTGSVNVLDPATGQVRSLLLNEEIENSFAIDEDGIYIVSDKKMYRFGLDANGTPTVVWSEPYQNIGIVKPGQVNAGSGTTPTLLHGGYVAITDNADPLNVVVYRTAATLPAGQSRLVCEVPVFPVGAGDTENSLIGAGSSLIVENNYGYTLASTANGVVTTPGITRVDIDADGNGCHVVWANTTERAPSAVPKLSLKAGLIYTITKDPDPVNTTADAWFWTAIDFQTGATVWKQLAGTGVLYNNHYAGVAISRRGTAYIGVIGGLVAIRDTQWGCRGRRNGRARCVRGAPGRARAARRWRRSAALHGYAGMNFAVSPAADP